MGLIHLDSRYLRRVVPAGPIAFAMIGVAACGSAGGVGSASTSTGPAATSETGTVQVSSAHSSATAVTLPSELTSTTGTPPASPAVSITPDADGTYRGITLDQVKDLAPFPVIVPARSSIPASLKFEGINASAKPPGSWGSPISAGWGPAQEVDLYYTAADGSRNCGVMISEVGHGFQYSAGPNATPSTLTIAGHSVAKDRVVRPKSVGASVTSYVWNNGKTYFTANVTYGGKFTETDFEAMIASTLGE